MGALGNIVGKAVDAVTGSSSGTTLQDFLSQFSSTDGIWAKTIDPYSSFDLYMKFFPPLPTGQQEEKNWLTRLTDAASTALTNAAKNAANNLTGGLAGSIMGALNGLDVMKEHDNNKDVSTVTFMEYLLASNMIVGKDMWSSPTSGNGNRPLELMLGLYCQAITMPNIEIPQSGASTNSLGEFPINGTIVKPDSSILQMKILNTVVPLHERIFYPWMREITQPWWSYDSQPYTTATITVDLTKHADIKYVFYGCRPSKIYMHQPTHDATSNMTRDISFLFDYMTIQSSLTTHESLTSKLMSTGKTLLNAGSKMLNGGR